MSLFYNLRYFCEELAIPWNSIMGKLYQRHLNVNCRSSRLQMFFKIDVLKNSVNFTWKYLCWSLFLLKLQAFRSATLLKRDSNTGVLRGKFARFLRTLFFTDHLWWLLLKLFIEAANSSDLKYVCHRNIGKMSLWWSYIFEYIWTPGLGRKGPIK